jgi:hypothetical protein
VQTQFYPALKRQVVCQQAFGKRAVSDAEENKRDPMGGFLEKSFTLRRQSVPNAYDCKEYTCIQK